MMPTKSIFGSFVRDAAGSTTILLLTLHFFKHFADVLNGETGGPTAGVIDQEDQIMDYL
jgi:hypothetical protein